MKIKTWNPSMTAEETKDLAYWERNALALSYADGWYNDDVVFHYTESMAEAAKRSGQRLPYAEPRYKGRRRVLSLEGGTVTFHIPDDFDVGGLQQIEPNWDGHTTEEKWRRILTECGVEVEP